jgi:hypothetical protein
VILNVPADLNTVFGCDDLPQSLTPLHNSLSRQVASVTPKHVEQVEDNRCGRALLLLLEQLEAGDSFLIQCDDLIIEKSLNADSALRPRP